MSGPMSSPFTAIGRVEQDIRDLERQMHGKVESYEVVEVRRRLDSLEHSLREISSENARLHTRLQELESDLRTMRTHDPSIV